MRPLCAPAGASSLATLAGNTRYREANKRRIAFYQLLDEFF
jgi:hypothetical protein